MRRFLSLAVVFFGLPLWVALGQDQSRIAQAEGEYARIQGLVEAGALPRQALENAADARDEARDEGVLRALLYGRVSLENLTEEQAREMLDAADRRLERKARRLEAAKRKLEAGVVPFTYLTPFLEDLDASRRVRELALARARLFEELVTMVRTEDSAEHAEEEAGQELPHMERFDGVGSFTTAQFQAISVAFEREFGRPLPVSAKGETALHRAWGFDHRGRVDVALFPDSKEGRWLLRFLEALRITYLAFRAPQPGTATAAHIHIGEPSRRIRRAD